MKILLDLDNVIVDFTGALRKWLTTRPCVAETAHAAAVRLHQTYHNHHCAPCMAALCVDPIATLEMQPIADAIKGIRTLRAFGQKLYVVTARPKKVELATEVWFRQRHMLHDLAGLIFDSRKVVIARELDVDIAIEDNPTNIAQLRDAGVPTIVFAQPYNQKLKAPRATSWPELIRLIVSLEITKRAPTSQPIRGLRPTTSLSERN